MAQHSSQSWKRLGSGTLPAEELDEGLGHIVPVPVYNKVFAGLVVFTILTLLAAMLPVGDLLHVTFALFIASIKAVLVGMFFMHLMYEKRLVWFIAIYPMFVLLLMIMGMVGDAADRRLPGPTTPGAYELPAHGHGLPTETTHHE